MTATSGPGDSGPFGDDPSKAGRGYQFFKFSPEGKLLLTLGKAGVSKAGRDTFIAPTACAVAPNGDIFIADGHFPRPSTSQQDGDRIVRFTSDGEFIDSWGQKGSGPGEFDGPHALAVDSQGRLFVADRSNNRIQVFDSEMNFVDDWRHFGATERRGRSRRMTRSTSRTRNPARGLRVRCAIRDGRTGSGSAARRTALSRFSSTARIPKA